ncbi:MAG: glycosyltransferase [Oscillospiraceae bacterium]
MPKISVIVAVYKMPEFLPRCIDGILGQTFRDLELILVDDGSPDHCGQICDEYAAKDRRVHVIHKENAGVCVARNTGLDWVYEHSDSEWIFFHDNDDWIYPETLERLYHAAIEQNTRISITAYQMTEGEDPVIVPEQLVPVAWTPKDFYLQHFVNATVCWGKLYHKSVFDGKRYPPGKYIEDEFLTYLLLFAQEKISVISAPMYAYYINRAGISKKAWVPKRLDAWEAYEQQLVYFKKMGDPELISFRTREYLENALKHYYAAQEAPNAAELTKELKWMRKRIRSLIRECWPIGRIAFWSDLDFLIDFYPMLTRIYRFWLDHKK